MSFDLISANSSQSVGSDGESVRLSVEELKTKRQRGVKVAFFTASVDWLVKVFGGMETVLAAKLAETLGMDAAALLVPESGDGSDNWPLRPFVHKDADVALFLYRGRGTNPVRLTDTTSLPEESGGGRDWASAKSFKLLVSPMDASKAGWLWVTQHGHNVPFSLAFHTIYGVPSLVLSHLSPERTEARIIAERAATEKAATEKAAAVHASKSQR